jgi:hypothetical protein
LNNASNIHTSIFKKKEQVICMSQHELFISSVSNWATTFGHGINYCSRGLENTQNNTVHIISEFPAVSELYIMEQFVLD